jgi:hypothetical protein
MMLSALFSALMLRDANVPQMPGGFPFLPINTTIGAISGLFGTCVSAFIAAALGALGGLLLGAFQRGDMNE